MHNSNNVFVFFFYKTNSISKQKLGESSNVGLYFCKSLKPGLIEDSWIPMPASSLNLLQYVILVKLYVENPASHKHKGEKGGP